MSGFFYALLVSMFVNYMIRLLIPNYYLASIISSVVIAFIYTMGFQRGRRFTDKLCSFFDLASIFLVIDVVFFLL